LPKKECSGYEDRFILGKPTQDMILRIQGYPAGAAKYAFMAAVTRAIHTSMFSE